MSPFTRAFLLLLSGPLIWVAHLLLIYVFTALACARQFAHVQWLGVGVVTLFIGVPTVAALGGMAALQAKQPPAEIAPDSAGFVRWTNMALSGLSALAVVWQALPAMIVPACG